MNDDNESDVLDIDNHQNHHQELSLNNQPSTSSSNSSTSSNVVEERDEQCSPIPISTTTNNNNTTSSNTNPSSITSSSLFFDEHGSSGTSPPLSPHSPSSMLPSSTMQANPSSMVSMDTPPLPLLPLSPTPSIGHVSIEPALNNRQPTPIIIEFENIGCRQNTVYHNGVVSQQANASARQLRLQRKLERRSQRRLQQHGQPRRNIYWNAMPIDIMEQILGLLSIKERHLASQVCPHWFECFYCPSIWTKLVVTDRSFTKRKFNYYLGYQRIIDPFKTQTYLLKFGHHLRQLIIRPMSNFFNLFEFMKILSQFAEHYEPNQLRYLYRFDFTFCCRSSPNTSMYNSSNNSNAIQNQQQRIGSFAPGGSNNNDRDVIGTGGKILEALKELLFYLTGLKHLALRDLLLDRNEAQTLLDNVTINCHEQLRSLTLINCCRSQCAFLHTGVFINLETLVISCQHLDEDVLIMLACNQRLNDIYIVQTEVTRSQGPLSASVWKKFNKLNRMQTRIHLVMINKTSYCQNPLTYELSLQPTQVTSIIYDAGKIRPTSTRLMEIGQLYSSCLQCLEFYHLPKYSIRKSYSDRVDSILIYLSQKCVKLRTIILNDLISTATLLLIATYARTNNITRLIVRRNAIRKRFDCAINQHWQDSFVEWLRTTSRSYELTFQEVSRLLGYHWQPLTDEQFKRLRPDVPF